jgi:GntR family transcriptional regulator, transcriptional repressor for pyruvate dehydrogenase complex
MSAELRRPQRLSLTQQCVESMKRHIAHHALKPGDRLPTEQEWAEMLRVSRLVVREALQVLAAIGLIDIQHGRGAFVRDMTQISVFDQLTFGLDLQQLSYTAVHEARAMLDLAVLELCMLRADQQALDELEELLHLMEQALEAGAPEHEYHQAFHQRMLRAAGNPLIERVGLVLMDTFWRIGDSVPGLIYPSTHQHGYNQIESHHMLLEAIRARDLAQSRQLVVRHLPVQPHASYVFPIVSEATAPERDRNNGQPQVED